jgi:hypothetical protein
MTARAFNGPGFPLLVGGGSCSLPAARKPAGDEPVEDGTEKADGEGEDKRRG